MTATIDWAARAADLRPTIANVIDGQRTEPGGEPVPKYAPRDGSLLYAFGAGTAADADRAVAAARAAHADGRWADMPAHRRKAILLDFADRIEACAEELALLECLDVGKPISDALAVDLPMAIGAIRYAAEAADKLTGKLIGADATSLSYQLRRPVGVVAGIVGWNFPLVLAANKIGPVLATGNSLVLKPSEVTSLATARLAELALEAGVPAGVLNIVHGGGEVGAVLARHDDVALLTFTGSTRTGKALLEAAGQSNMKRLVLECGGKAANIVFDDCPDLAAVADAIVARAFWNQGQVCTASSRLLVQQGVKDQLLALVIEKTAAMLPGDPLLAETRLGPLASELHRRKVQDYVESGSKDGARMIYRAERSEPCVGGFYAAPVIFDDVRVEHRIARDEIFGPVLAVMGFEDEAEAVALANGTIYGLSAILWTRDLGRAHRVSQRIEAGWVVVNATAAPSGGPGPGALPVGGLKQSGIGIEGGLEGLEHYLSKSAVQLFV